MLVNNILDVLFPRFCIGCGYVGRYVCPRCEKRIKKEKFPSRCFYCEKKSLLGLTHPVCKRKYGIDAYTFTYSYRELFKKIIHIAKYKGAYEVLKEIMLFPSHKAFHTVLRWTALFPLEPHTIPLSDKKTKERGFNQGDYIALPFLSILKKRPLSVLKKIKETKSQATLHSNKEREGNVKNSFVCTSNVKGKNILLIDDVVTTGSTVKECAKILKKSGALHVCVLSLARG